MQPSFLLSLDTWLIALVTFVAMTASAFLGHRIGRARFKNNGDSSSSSSVTGSMLGLLAFLLAFTFGMSGSRYDARRKVVVDEANAIGTAILRSDLYPEEERAAFRKDFRVYLEAR